MAPPCGTSSRARERPLPNDLSHIRAEPLRSEDRPLGLEGLSGLDAVRVGAANKSYALTVWAAVLALMVRHSWLRDLWGSMEDNTFQACMYGSDRDKWTTIKATKGFHTEICKTCDKSHKHRSWAPQKVAQGVHFPTTQETEYPKKLCETMASCLCRFLRQKGVT